MNKYLTMLGLGVMIGAVPAFAATTWDLVNNRVTYSVFEDNFQLGQDQHGNNLTKSVALSQLNLSTVAQQEGVGSSANYILTSVVLSMNETVYGTIYYKNNSASSTTPSFKVTGYSELTFGTDVTPAETYSRTTPIGTIAPGGEYSDANVSVAGSTSAKTVTITEDLQRFLGTGTIETIGAFPVDGYFSSGGTDWDANVSLQGKADIAVTYNYEYSSSAPEPTSMALIALGCAALGLRRKRIFTV